MEAESKGVQSLNRALDILEALAMDTRGLTLTELSRRVGLHKSTVHRLLATLSARHYVEESGQGFRLGLRVVEVGSRLLNSMELITEAEPLLRTLSSRLGRVAHLAVLDEGEVVYLGKVEPVNSIRMYSQIGRRAPFHCTGLGKVMAAFHSDEEVDRWIERFGLPRMMPNTIVDPVALRAEFARIRQRDYGLDDVEHEENIRCVAAPIRDYRRRVIAAISVTGRADEFTRELAEQTSVEVLAVTREISRRMGYTIAT